MNIKRRDRTKILRTIDLYYSFNYKYKRGLSSCFQRNTKQFPTCLSTIIILKYCTDTQTHTDTDTDTDTDTFLVSAAYTTPSTTNTCTHNN